MSLLHRIEQFRARTGLSVTKFGRLAVHDPRFVLDLRMGRDPRPGTRSRVEHFMNNFELSDGDSR